MGTLYGGKRAGGRSHVRGLAPIGERIDELTGLVRELYPSTQFAREEVRTVVEDAYKVADVISARRRRYGGVKVLSGLRRCSPSTMPLQRPAVSTWKR